MPFRARNRGLIRAGNGFPFITGLPTGGVITEPGDGFRYHTFLTNGTFTPVTPITVEYLVVGGGGGSGDVVVGTRFTSAGAGGRVRTGSTTISTAQTITVGAGGLSEFASGVNGQNGGTSSLGSIASATGGQGGGVPGDGLGGNNGDFFGSDITGNGGGAGAGAGANASGTNGGNGFLWSNNNTYGGGGAGRANASGAFGTGGTGGGGSNSPGTDGLGGGGSGSTTGLERGGSGVVIIRYSIATILFSSSFTQANSTDISPFVESGSTSMEIIGNLMSNSVSSPSASVTRAFWPTALPNHNHYNQAKLGGSAKAASVYARGDSPSTPVTYYETFWETTASGTVTIRKVVSGVATVLATKTSITFNAGDTLRLECQGTSIRALVNGVVVVTVSDNAIQTGRYVGFRMDNNASTVDDFEAGSLPTLAHLVSDPFTRANSAGLGGYSVAEDAATIASDAFQFTTGTSGSWVTWNGFTFPADQYAELDVVTNAGQISGALCRFMDQNNFYVGRINDLGADTYELYRRVGGTYTLLNSLAETFPAYPFRVRLQVIGTALTFQVWNGSAWVTKCSATDSSFTAGAVGLFAQRISGNITLDNFAAGYA